MRTHRFPGEYPGQNIYFGQSRCQPLRVKSRGISRRAGEIHVEAKAPISTLAISGFHSNAFLRLKKFFCRRNPIFPVFAARAKFGLRDVFHC